jgi:hypothetical protein
MKKQERNLNKKIWYRKSSEQVKHHKGLYEKFKKISSILDALKPRKHQIFTCKQQWPTKTLETFRNSITHMHSP